MKREEQSFDELIRGKLENRSFTPNPQSWQKAEQLMKAKQAAKTGFSGMAAAATTIVVAGSIFALVYYFSGNKEKLVSENNKTKTIQTVSATPFQEDAKNENAAQSGNHFSSKEEATNANPENVPAKDLNAGPQEKKQDKENTAENYSGKTNSEKTSTHTGHPGKTVETTPGKSEAANNPGNTQGKTGNAQGQNSGKAKHGQQAKNTGENSSTAKNASPGNEVQKGLAKKENAAGTKSTTSTPAQAANTGDENAASNPANASPENPALVNQAPNSSRQLTDSNSIALQPSDANTKAQTAGTNIHPAAQPPDSLTAVHQQPSSTEQTAPGPVSTTTTNPQAAAEKTGRTNSSAGQLAQQQSATEKQKAGTLPAKADSVEMNTLPPPSRHNGGTSYVFAQAGMSFIPPFSNNDHSGRSLNPVIGGGFGFRLKGMWEMQMGLRYTFIGHASDSSHIYVTTTYTFGAQQHYTEIRLVRMHYLTAPFVVRWHAGPNIFLAGASASYLFASESRRSTYDEAADNSIANKRTVSIFGYEEGLNRFDAQLSAGYARSFGRNWSAELSAYYGLLDLKKNAFYGVNKFERNKGLQFIVQYSF